VSAGRFLAAGLVAGIANLVVGFSLAHVVGIQRLQELLLTHGLRAIGQPSDALAHVLVRIGVGVLVTGLFVCLTPRFGIGPRAAFAAAAFAWLSIPVFTAWGHAHIGLFPGSMAWAWAGCGALEMLVTAFVGGWVASGRRFGR
jgi:hypothetical protein